MCLKLSATDTFPTGSRQSSPFFWFLMRHVRAGRQGIVESCVEGSDDVIDVTVFISRTSVSWGEKKKWVSSRVSCFHHCQLKLQPKKNRDYRRVTWPRKECWLYPFPAKTIARCLLFVFFFFCPLWNWLFACNWLRCSGGWCWQTASLKENTRLGSSMQS